MKITFELEDSKCIVEDPSAVDVFDTFQLIKQGLMGIGFHPESIDDGIEMLYDEIENRGEPLLDEKQNNED